MLVYLADKQQFKTDIESGTIDGKIQKAIGQRVSDSERRSWNNSLVYMNLVLSEITIPDDVGIGIEMKIPQTSKRIDVILSGLGQLDSEHAIIVELKQWDKALSTNRDGIVQTFVGGALRYVPHPSYQAWSYASLLEKLQRNCLYARCRPAPLRVFAQLSLRWSPDECAIRCSFRESPLYLERVTLSNCESSYSRLLRTGTTAN